MCLLLISTKKRFMIQRKSAMSTSSHLVELRVEMTLDLEKSSILEVSDTEAGLGLIGRGRFS